MNVRMIINVGSVSLRIQEKSEVWCGGIDDDSRQLLLLLGVVVMMMGTSPLGGVNLIEKKK